MFTRDYFSGSYFAPAYFPSAVDHSSPIDLVTLADATLALAPVGLSADQLLYLPTAITAASRAVMDWCGQNIKQQNYDQILSPMADGFVLPPQQPVNYVTRVGTARQSVLTVQNTSSSVQWATVGYAVTGDWATGETVTGLTLTWMSSGVQSSSTVTFGTLSPPTVQSLADAVNAVGSGWTATVAQTFGPWGTSELITADVAAQDGIQGAYLEVWSQNLSGAKVTNVGRVIDLRYSGATQYGGMPFGFNFTGVYGGGFGSNVITWPQVKVVYNAGYAVVPQAVQQATIEAVKILLERLRTEMVTGQEKADGYSYQLTTPDLIESIPLACRQQLTAYRVRFIGRP